MKIKYALYVIVLLFLVNKSAAQFPGIQLHESNSLYFNPAFAGTRKFPSTGISYLYQGNSRLPYHTNIGTFDNSSHILHGGVGVIALSDYAADNSLRNNALEACYSFRSVLTRRLVLCLGLKSGIRGSSLRPSSTTVDRFSGTITHPGINTLPSNRHVYFNSGAGLLLYSRNWFLSFFMDHLNKPKQINGRIIPYQYIAIANLNLESDTLESTFHLTATYRNQDSYLILDYIYGPIIQSTEILDFTFNLSYNDLRAGLGYRHFTNRTDSYILQFNYSLGPIQLGYDIGVSEFSGNTKHLSAMHQIYSQFRFRKYGCRRLFKRLSF